MTTLVQRVRRAIERDGLVAPGARVLVAISGGSDSVALAHLLLEIAPALPFTVAGLAHLNHQLRGADSDADEVFCRDLAASLDLPFESRRADVGAMARVQRVSLEVAARRARYRFLSGAAERVDADLIATGHTRDDQAETVLLRLLRGAGATGLAAIPPRRGLIIRPVLDERRETLRAYLAECRVSFREDVTNQDRTIPRNWVRHELLPLLASHLGGDIVEVLAREAAILRDDAAMLEAVADEAARATLELDEGQASFETESLQALPPALARRVIRRALSHVSPAFQGAAHVDRVLEAARGAKERANDLPGARMELIGGRVVLYRRDGRGRRQPAVFRYALPVPGRVVVAEADVVVEADAIGNANLQQVIAEHVGGNGLSVVIDAAVAAEGLWIRQRRPGDTYRPFGLGRNKKLQDVFVDRKVPRDRRDRVPLVVDAHDRIVWVTGLGPADDVRVTESTQSVVTLKVRQLGDLG
jgi:tRNA(Ile)-lysidine synthase